MTIQEAARRMAASVAYHALLTMDGSLQEPGAAEEVVRGVYRGVGKALPSAKASALADAFRTSWSAILDGLKGQADPS